MFRRIAKTVCIVSALVATHPLMAGEAEDPDDLIARIAACLPTGWKVDLGSGGKRDFVIRITTLPVVTHPSHYSNAEEGEVTQPVTIEFQVLPKHSPAMLQRIREHNKPFVARLKKIPYHTDEAERCRLRESMVPYPQFQDDQYGYIVSKPGWVPKRSGDFGTLRETLDKICKDWQPADEEGMKVEDIPRIFHCP